MWKVQLLGKNTQIVITQPQFPSVLWTNLTTLPLLFLFATLLFLFSHTICESQHYLLKQIQNMKAFNANWEIFPAKASHSEASVPLVSWAHSAKCSWHIPRSLSCPKQPLYQNYPPKENQFVYLWRVLHIRHFKPWLACSFTEKTSDGLKRVGWLDHCQQAKEQFKKRWPGQTSPDRLHVKQQSYILYMHTVHLNLFLCIHKIYHVGKVACKCSSRVYLSENISHHKSSSHFGLYFRHLSIITHFARSGSVHRKFNKLKIKQVKKKVVI